MTQEFIALNAYMKLHKNPCEHRLAYYWWTLKVAEMLGGIK
jgi:hypothetical protein